MPPSSARSLCPPAPGPSSPARRTGSRGELRASSARCWPGRPTGTTTCTTSSLSWAGKSRMLWMVVARVRRLGRSCGAGLVTAACCAAAHGHHVCARHRQRAEWSRVRSWAGGPDGQLGRVCAGGRAAEQRGRRPSGRCPRAASRRRQPDDRRQRLLGAGGGRRQRKPRPGLGGGARLPVAEGDVTTTLSGSTGTRLDTWNDPRIEALSDAFGLFEAAHQWSRPLPAIVELPLLVRILSELVERVVWRGHDADWSCLERWRRQSKVLGPD